MFYRDVLRKKVILNTAEEFKKILDKGETDTVEFKSWIKARNQKEIISLAVDELIAFANYKGGTVYFGVEDKPVEVTGCDRDYDGQRMIESIYDKTRPSLFTEIEDFEYEGKLIIALSVKSDGKTYTTTDGRCLKRLGKNSKPLYPDELSNVYSSSQNPDFSGRIISESTLEDVNKLEVDEFPERVFQEALLNALSHRDYQSNAAVYVKQYPDRIVIENPGGFLDGINENNIITHPSVPRNKLIAETLQNLKYVQRTGQGVDIIFKDMVSMGKPYPRYESYNDAVSLTIFSTIDNTEFVKFIIEVQDKNSRIMPLSEMMILRDLMDNRKEQLSVLAVTVQKSLDETKKSCNELVNNGLIEIVGKEYMLTAKVYKALKSDVEYTRDKTVQYIKAKNMILEYLQSNDKITSAKIQEMCGFTKQQARVVIDKMRKEELLDICKQGKNSYYVKL